MTDSEVIQNIQNWFQLTLVTPLDNTVYYTLLDDYRLAKAQGWTDAALIDAWSNDHTSDGKAIETTTFMIPTFATITKAQAGAFIAAMNQMNKGAAIQDPNESPSWSEAYGMSGLSTLSNAIPWKTILAVGAAIYFLPGMLARYSKAKNSPSLFEHAKKLLKK